MLILRLLIISVWDETYLCDGQSAGRGVIVTQAVQHLSTASAIDLHTGTQGWDLNLLLRLGLVGLNNFYQ